MPDGNYYTENESKLISKGLSLEQIMEERKRHDKYLMKSSLLTGRELPAGEHTFSEDVLLLGETPEIQQATLGKLAKIISILDIRTSKIEKRNLEPELCIDGLDIKELPIIKEKNADKSTKGWKGKHNNRRRFAISSLVGDDEGDRMGEVQDTLIIDLWDKNRSVKTSTVETAENDLYVFNIQFVKPDDEHREVNWSYPEEAATFGYQPEKEYTWADHGILFHGECHQGDQSFYANLRARLDNAIEKLSAKFPGDFSKTGK